MLTFEDQCKTIGTRFQLSDHFDASEAASHLFDAWYKLAVAYAKGELAEGAATILHSTQTALSYMILQPYPGMLIAASTHPAIIARICDEVAKILTIYVTKPKFAALVPLAEAVPLCSWLRTTLLSELQTGALRSAITSSSRVSFFKALRCLAQYANVVRSASSDVPAFPFDIAAITAQACESANERMLRSGAMDVLQELVEYFRDDVLRHLCSSMCDREAVDRAWAFGALQNATAMKMLLSRIMSASSTAAAGSGEAPLGLVVALSLSDAFRTGILKGELIAQALPLLHAADVIRSAYRRDESESGDERAEEMLTALNTFLALAPDSAELLHLVLKEPVTLETLNLLQANAARFAQVTWIHTLLPFCTRHIAAMQMSGVSGHQHEQNVINIVRECGRVFYISSQHHPSAELGYALFMTTLSAMQRGYIQTERFPAVAALIVRRHLTDNSTRWLQAAFDREICHNMKTTRAVCDLVQELIAVAEVRDVVVHALLASTASGALQVTLTLLQSNTLVLSAAQQYDALRTIAGILSDPGSAEPAVMEPLLELVRAMAFRLDPSNAMFMLSIAVSLASDQPAAISDEVLNKILQQVHDLTAIPSVTVNDAMCVAGPLTRAALAPVQPLLCLHDSHADVRIAALTHLTRQMETSCHLVTELAEDICAAVQPPQHEHTELREVDTSECALLIAAAPLLAVLARQLPELMSRCVALLLRGAALSASSDVRNLPDTVILSSLNAICVHVHENVMETFLCGCSSATLSALASLSSGWKETVTEHRAVQQQQQSQRRSGSYQLLPMTESDEHVVPVGSVTASGSKHETWQALQHDLQSKDLLAALHHAHQVKLGAPSVWAQQNGDQLLQNTILPRLSDTLATPATVNTANYPTTALALSTLLRLFPEQGETVLRAGARLAALQNVIVVQFLNQSDAGAARKWMQRENVSSAILNAQIQRWEERQQQQQQQQEQTAISSTVQRFRLLSPRQPVVISAAPVATMEDSSDYRTNTVQAWQQRAASQIKQYAQPRVSAELCEL